MVAADPTPPIRDDPRRRRGNRGEDAALARYGALGYRLVARNWRCRLGEIDLLVARGSVLVVCEVKTRRGGAFGGPFEAVTVSKQRKVRSLAEVYLASTGADPAEVRFDVASVTLDERGRASVHLFEGAF